MWFIVATYFSLELLYSRPDNGAVRHRRQGETKGETRETLERRESSDNQNTKLRLWAPTPQQYMTGSDLYIEVVRLHTGATITPPNPEIIIRE